jgi:hypothetical protein
MFKKKDFQELEKTVHNHFHFRDTNEYIIFLVWAVFVSAFLLTFTK